MALSLRNFWVSSSAGSKTSGTTIPLGTGVLAEPPQVGDWIVGFAMCDNLANSGPTVSGITGPNGSHGAVYTEAVSTSGSSAGVATLILFRCQATANYTAGDTTMWFINLSNAVTAKVGGICVVRTGAGALTWQTMDSAGNLNTTRSYTLTGDWTGAMLFGGVSNEAPTIPAVTWPNGAAIQQVVSDRTTGGGSASNIAGFGSVTLSPSTSTYSVNANLVDGGFMIWRLDEAASSSPVTATPTGIASSQTFGTPTSTITSPGTTASPTGIASAQVFGTASATRQSVPSTPYSNAVKWNTPIATLYGTPTIRSDSATLMARVLDGKGATPQRNYLGSDTSQSTLPIYYVTNATPTVTVRVWGSWRYGSDTSVAGTYQVDQDITVPMPVGGTKPPGTSDYQVVIINTDTGEEWNFWKVGTNVDESAQPGVNGSGVWVAYDIGGGVMRYTCQSAGLYSPTGSDSTTTTGGYLTGNGKPSMTPQAWGMRGAKIPYAIGLVRKSEVDSGTINHAVAWAYHGPSPDFVDPAQNSDGGNFGGVSGSDIPEGARIRLKPSFDVTSLPAGTARIVGQALKDYGAILIDNSGFPKVYLESDNTAGWTDVTATMLSAATLADYEVIEWVVAAPPSGSFGPSGTAQAGNLTSVGSSMVVTLATGAATGDLDIIAATVQSSTVTFSTLTGWNLLTTQLESSGVLLAVWTRFRQAGDPSTVTVAWTGGTAIGGWNAIAISGVDTTTPLGTPTKGTTNTGTTAFNLPALTTTGTNSYRLAFGANGSGSTTFDTAPTGLTELIENTGGKHITTAGATNASPQTWAASTWTTNIAGRGSAIHVEVFPAASTAITASPTGIASAQGLGAVTATIPITSRPTGIASAEAFGTPARTSALTSSPTGIATAEAFGVPVESATLTATPTGISSAEVLGTAVAQVPRTASPTGIVTAEAFGTATEQATLTSTPTGVATAEAFGSATANKVLTSTAVAIGTAEAMGSPTATVASAGGSTLPQTLPFVLGGGTGPASPTGIASAQAMGTPTATKSIPGAPTGITTAEAFGVPTVSGSLTAVATGVATAGAFGTPTSTFSRVPITASPTAIAGAEALGVPSATKVLTSSATGISSAETFGTPQSVNTVSPSPSGITSAEAFGTPTANTALTYTATGISSAEAFGTATETGALTASPTGIASAGAFGTTVANKTLTAVATGIGTAEAIGTATELSTLTSSPTGIASGEAIGVPLRVLGGQYNPTALSSSEAFGTPAVTGALTATATGISSAQAMGVPTATKVLVATAFAITSPEVFGAPLAKINRLAVAVGIASGQAFGIPQRITVVTQFVFHGGAWIPIVQIYRYNGTAFTPIVSIQKYTPSGWVG